MTDKKIKVYSTPTCPYCVTLKRFLEQNDVEFKDVDISEDEEALEEMKKKSGQSGVPVVEIGDEVIVGFEKEKIKKLLDL
ncbi:MAG: glutaredoxin family protein [Candidatus Paceibacterota bacterium]